MAVSYSHKAVLSWENEREEFSVHEPFTVSWRDKQITVPYGFRTDLASIPQLMQAFISPIGRHIQPACVHDFCYRTDTGLTRAEADLLFLEGMKAMGEPDADIMYAAVRWMGAESWANTPDLEDLELEDAWNHEGDGE